MIDYVRCGVGEGNLDDWNRVGVRRMAQSLGLNGSEREALVNCGVGEGNP